MKKILKLKSTLFARSSFATKSFFKALPGLLTQKDPDILLQALIGKNIEGFVDDVGELKGSILKAAQILSVYGEYYLPKEVNQVLKSVQSQSHYLPWSSIQKVIPDSFYYDLEIDEIPNAAASIGQLHLATNKTTKDRIALKVQYPGIKKAIDLDIKILKGFISLTKILPRKIDMSMIYAEIKRVMIEEMDYLKEREKQESYAEIVRDFDHYYVPKVYREYSTETIIATEYVDAPTLAEISFTDLDQQVKNDIGKYILYLFFHEVFRGNLIQTDCHAGNYLVQIREGEVKLVLIDFGACLYFDQQTINNYRNLLRSLFHNDREAFFNELRGIFDRTGAPFDINEQKLWNYARLAQTPLHSHKYDWGATTLPDELYALAKDMINETQIEKPPHQFIFLDRKILGVFSILKSLEAKFDVSTIAEEFLKEA